MATPDLGSAVKQAQRIAAREDRAVSLVPTYRGWAAVRKGERVFPGTDYILVTATDATEYLWREGQPYMIPHKLEPVR